MLRTDFEFLIKHKLLIIEGSLNSEIQRRVKAPFPFTPQYVLDQPDLVKQIHSDFSKAGAHILVAGTAAANRLVLERKALQDHFQAMNRKSVALAREVAAPECMVFAGLGPTGALLKPYGQLVEDDYRSVYREQAEFLIKNDVDGFILEGFSSLIEAEQCILALRDCSSLPVIATMTFLEDGLTKFGDTMEDCFKTLLHKGADVAGIHGTLGPLEIDEYLSRLSQPYNLCVRPNAGYPVRLGNTTTYLSSPEYVSECAELFVDKGCNIIGGASGFTPDHIRAISQKLRGRAPVEKRSGRIGSSMKVELSEESAVAGTVAPVKKLADKLGREPVITVELEPPKGLEIDSIIQLLHKLQPYGVDAVNIPENPLARARISSIALARAIFDETGIESITHLTCRDRNLISLQAELLGAHVLGVNTILALTGDPSGVGDFPAATSVFDVDSLGLVEIMNRMNLGKDFGMNDLGSHTQFNIGVACNPLARDLDAELARLEKKIHRGASFVQTQPIFDPSRVESFLKALESFQVPVIFGVMLIRDYRHAKFLANEYPGIYIKDKDLDRFNNAGEEEQGQLGVQLACELVNELNAMSGGVYLMPGFGDAERLVDVFAQLKK